MLFPWKYSFFLLLKLLTCSCSHVRWQPHDNWPKWQRLFTTATMTTPYFMSVQALNKNQWKHTNAIPNFISKVHFFGFWVQSCSMSRFQTCETRWCYHDASTSHFWLKIAQKVLFEMPKNPYKLISPQAGRHSEVCDHIIIISQMMIVLSNHFSLIVWLFVCCLFATNWLTDLLTTWRLPLTWTEPKTHVLWWDGLMSSSSWSWFCSNNVWLPRNWW